MHPIRLIPALLAALLVLAACGGQPAFEMTDPAPAVQESASEDMASEEMADNESAGDDMAEGGMTDEEEAGDDVASDADHGDDMAGDDIDGEEMDAGDMSGEESDDEASRDGDMDADDTETAVERPAWQQIELTDARSGETFTLADYGDKPVFVEPFATWCSNCRRQLGNVQSAYTSLGEDAVFVALSVEPNIANEALVDYADKEGFEYTFAAMPPEMLQELAAIFGQTVSNPPATPHFIIWPDGSTTDLATGFEAPEAIVEQLGSAG